MSKTVRVAQIVGPFGIKGQVKLKLLTDFPERFESGRRLRLNDEWVTIEEALVHKNQLVVRLSGVKDRTDAERLQWNYLEALADERPELEEDDEYFTEDLVGLAVVTTDGRGLGKVDRVDAYPAHDVLVVGKILIPAVKAFVQEIDLDEERITVQLIPGMEDEEDVS
ncbi:MAG: 16S rRNA processing protein RimM [Methanoregulaceae archaeon]|nr:16S rRNA processing protein RimM [Methanoregulaceae archaeon]